MNETLHLVNRTVLDGGVSIFVVIATVEKLSQGYLYTPRNLDIDATPRPKQEQVTQHVPPILAERTFSPKRPDLGKLLNKYGLAEYDVWEILKKTKGRQVNDDLILWTQEEYEFSRLYFGAQVRGFFGEMSATRSMEVGYSARTSNHLNDLGSSMKNLGLEVSLFSQNNGVVMSYRVGRNGEIVCEYPEPKEELLHVSKSIKAPGQYVMGAAIKGTAMSVPLSRGDTIVRKIEKGVEIDLTSPNIRNMSSF